LVSEKEKQDYNEIVKKDNPEVGHNSRVDKEGIYFVAVFKKAFYCRHEGCQKMTKSVFIADLSVIEKMGGIKPSGTVMHIPLCEEHLQERLSLVKVVDKNKLF
jgi:hypothetical protein